MVVSGFGTRGSLGLARAFAVAIAGLVALAPASAQIVAERLASDSARAVVRYHADPGAKQNRLPSFAMEGKPTVIGPADPGAAPEPVFSRDAEGRFVTTFSIDEGTSLYGTGQAFGPLERSGFVTETWNWDAYGYGDTKDLNHLYTSHPWVLAVRADGSSYGVLADTTYRCEMDLTSGIVFRAEGRPHPVVVIEGEHPEHVVAALGELTGTIEMPPKWAVGYHQCRYSYYPDSRVREVARGFRDRALPADVIWMDIDYMDSFKVFTWDESGFPDPAGLNAYLDTIGFSNVWMIDPGVANEEGYFVHDQGDELDVWVQAADGSEYTGHVWPGECVFPDYTNGAVREWWAGLYHDFMATGIDGVWNDMNEPAVFVMKDGQIQGAVTMPEDNIHRADPALGGEGPHARYHNVYGMLMVKASREGVMAANPGKRPFVLSRANFIGGHRYAATWTGDNSSTWPHVDASISMTLNLGLSGQPFVGPDIGGFINEGTPEMYSRWFGFGALLPFARGHTQKGNIDKEPWSFGPEVEATCRRALERRYRLIPHFYTLFEEAHRTGVPVARPLFFADPSNQALRGADDAFMLGDDLIVHVQTSEDRSGRLVLPTNGAWREFDFASFDGGRDSADPDQPRLFLRAGGIVPTGPVHQHFGDRPDQRDELTLLVALDGDGRASGELYEDEGEGWGFREGGYLRTRYTAESDGDRVHIATHTIGGHHDRPDRTLRIRLLLADGREINATGLDGKPISIKWR